MADFTTNKIDGNQVAAIEWNQLADIDNAIINATGNPSTGDLNQLSKAMAANAATATFYTDSGTANNYVLTPIGNFKTPFSYTDGMEVRFRPTNNSSSTSQVSVGTLGAKTIKLEDGTTNISTEITTSNDVVLRYDATSGYFFFIKTIPVSATTTVAGIVELLTGAELQAGTDTTRAATAAAIASLFETSSRSSNGYARLPIKVGGAFVEIIAQWGTTILIGADNIGTVTLPITYPNSILNIQATSNTRITGAGNGNAVQAGSISNSQIQVYPSGYDQVIMWLTIGY